MEGIALKKGAEALGKELGVFGEKAVSGKAPVVATAVAYSPVGSSSSIATISEKRVTETMAITQSEEETNVSKFLEDDICENIYQSCAARVALMSRNRSMAAGVNAEEAAQEAKEWEAAKDMATEVEEDFKSALEEAKKETQTAAKKLASADAILYGKAYADRAFYDWQVKDLAEKLAKARVATAHETLNALKFRNTAQQTRAEGRLNTAIEMERNASAALAAATANTSSEEIDTTTSPSTGQKSQVIQNSLRRNSVEEKDVDLTQGFMDLPTAPQSPLSSTPPKSPTPGFNAIVEQTFATPSIPIATAVEFNAVNKFTIAEPLNSLKLSEESIAQDKAAAFEIEFSEMIKNAKNQAEEAAAAATTAREKAEKQGASEKVWNEALGEARIAEKAYTHLIEFYQMYSEQAAEHYEGGMLKTKCSKYKIELTRAEGKKAHWTSEVEECKQKKEALKQEETGKALEQARAMEAKAAQERDVARAAEQEKARLESERKATEEKAAVEKAKAEAEKKPQQKKQGLQSKLE